MAAEGEAVAAGIPPHAAHACPAPLCIQATSAARTSPAAPAFPHVLAQAASAAPESASGHAPRQFQYAAQSLSAEHASSSVVHAVDTHVAQALFAKASPLWPASGSSAGFVSLLQPKASSKEVARTKKNRFTLPRKRARVYSRTFGVARSSA
jgi:hypothetical protein